MKVVNSYIFISKHDVQFDKKNNTVTLHKIVPSIFHKIFNTEEESMLLTDEAENHEKSNEASLDRFNKVREGTFIFRVDDYDCNLTYRFVGVDSTYYLDISINDKKNIIINCLAKINEILLNNEEIKLSYVPIISYDYVSESYCNILYPLLNRFERKFRKLLFLIFTAEFKSAFFDAMAPEQLQNDVKKRIGHIKGKNENDYRLQNYFYSLDFGMLRGFLFDKNWTLLEENEKKEILNQNLTELNEDEIKKLIDNIGPKSNWERFFANKGFNDNINNTMVTINKLRNIVAHNKLIDYNEFEKLKNILNENIKIIDKAIRITESEDFRRINIKRYDEFLSSIKDSINNTLVGIRNNLYTRMDKISELLQDLSKKSMEIQEVVISAITSNIDDE